MLIHWVVVRTVIRHEEPPSAIFAVVVIAPVKDVTMEEQRVSWLELHVHELAPVMRELHALQVRAHLLANLLVLYAAQQLRPFQHLRYECNASS